MEMTRFEVREFYGMIEATLKSEETLDFDVIYALTKTKGKLRHVAEEIVEMIENTRKAEQQLCLKFCDKDDEGKPVTEDNRFSGLEIGKHPEYDNAIEDLISKRTAFLNEKINVEIHHINKEIIPKKGKANILETLCYFVKEEK